MSRLERTLLTITVIFGVLTLSVVAGMGAGHGFSLHGWGQVRSANAYTGSYYGANEAWVAIGATEWPQKGNNWCGPANIEVVANYTFQMIGGENDTPFLSGGQQRIVNDLDSSAAASEWGTPGWNGTGPGFHADIAQDGGLDPRGMAWGIFYESADGYLLRPTSPPNPRLNVPRRINAYHDVIYHVSAGYTVAIGGLARTLERYSQPISVTIAHGLHFDVVSGVYAGSDPINTYPNSNVNAVTTWDPAVGTSTGGYQSSREVTWANYTFNTNTDMWGSTYNSNNGYDPDPSVGIYTPNSTYPTHWIGNRTDFEPDQRLNVGVDYALDENGTVMQHP